MCALFAITPVWNAFSRVQVQQSLYAIDKREIVNIFKIKKDEDLLFFEKFKFITKVYQENTLVLTVTPYQRKDSLLVIFLKYI